MICNVIFLPIKHIFYWNEAHHLFLIISISQTCKSFHLLSRGSLKSNSFYNEDHLLTHSTKIDTVRVSMSLHVTFFDNQKLRKHFSKLIIMEIH